MQRGEIWLVDLTPVKGSEQDGKRPVLIVSATSFNTVTGRAIVVPITGGGSSARTAGFTVPLSGSGCATVGVVRCDQPRTLDLKARRGHKLEAVPDFIIDETLAKLASILE